MKEGFVLKGGKAPESGDLEKINCFTRRRFSADELYTFPVVLCDNEIDRDNERFTVDALKKLAELFIGKTGIFNHSPQAQNQTARIYDCRVEVDKTRMTSAGEPYARLVAQAYLPKTDSNADFITELESGIKKEVSVGCAVSKVTCSICGADLKNGGCEHVRGQQYDGAVCCAVLDEPTDAYEWSFVAVPSQRGAGVIKSFHTGKPDGACEILKEAHGEVTLTKAQADQILARISGLKQNAEDGRAYRDALKKEFIRCASLAQPALPGGTLSRAADALSAEDLKQFTEAFRRQAEDAIPLTPQLAAAEPKSQTDGNAPFRI